MLLRCAFSPDGSKVAAGSSDSFVCIWSFDSGKLIYRLPGHKGSVNEVFIIFITSLGFADAMWPCNHAHCVTHWINTNLTSSTTSTTPAQHSVLPSFLHILHFFAGGVPPHRAHNWLLQQRHEYLPWRNCILRWWQFKQIGLVAKYRSDVWQGYSTDMICTLKIKQTTLWYNFHTEIWIFITLYV